MKRYIVTEWQDGPDSEVVVGHYKTKAEAQKNIKDNQWIYEVTGYWCSRPKMELEKLALTELAE
jgi:hypothetical protein